MPTEHHAHPTWETVGLPLGREGGPLEGAPLGKAGPCGGAGEGPWPAPWCADEQATGSAGASGSEQEQPFPGSLVGRPSQRPRRWADEAGPEPGRSQVTPECVCPAPGPTEVTQKVALTPPTVARPPVLLWGTARPVRLLLLLTDSLPGTWTCSARTSAGNAALSPAGAPRGTTPAGAGGDRKARSAFLPCGAPASRGRGSNHHVSR